MAKLDSTLLEDPLREPTRKARRTLVAVSFVSSAMALFNIAPSQITVLGTPLPLIVRPKLWIVLAVVVVYFLLEFCIYAAPDLLGMSRALYKFQADTWETEVQLRLHGENPSPEYGEIMQRKSYGLLKWSALLVKARILLDFILPALMGTGAVVLLIVTAIRG